MAIVSVRSHCLGLGHCVPRSSQPIVARGLRCVRACPKWSGHPRRTGPGPSDRPGRAGSASLAPLGTLRPGGSAPPTCLHTASPAHLSLLGARPLPGEAVAGHHVRPHPVPTRPWGLPRRATHLRPMSPPHSHPDVRATLGPWSVLRSHPIGCAR